MKAKEFSLLDRLHVEGLENCLPEKGHAALLTVRRAGNVGGALYWSKPDAEKPDYDGERERARKNTSKRPECANKPTHTADWQNVVGLCRYCPSFHPPGGPAGTRYQLPARYDSRDLRNVYRRLYGFTDYGIVSPPTILASYTRSSGDEPDFQPSRVETTIEAKRHNKQWLTQPDSLRSARRIRFEEKVEVKGRLAKNRAPRDTSEGNIDESNIVRGKRVRKKTPTTASTHLYKLAIAEDDETQFAPQQGMTDGLRYEDVCLFTRVLRKPEKQLRLIPQIVEARKKEVQGLYDAKCLQWATWRDAEKDKVKPIRTGFVDAIKVEQHDELIRRLRAARFRFTDKGDVESILELHQYSASALSESDKDSKHPVLGNVGGALYWSKPDAEKPDYDGERERARKNTSKRPECANKPTHTGGPAGTRYQLPARYDSRDLRNVYRRLYGFTDYGIVSPPTILASYTRSSGDEPDFQPSRVETTIEAKRHNKQWLTQRMHTHGLSWPMANSFFGGQQKAVAFFMVQANATEMEMAEWAIRLVSPIPIGNYKMNPQMWDEDAEKGNQMEQTDTVSPLQKTEQITREDRNICPQVSAEKAEEAEGESTILVVDDDSLPAQRCEHTVFRGQTHYGQLDVFVLKRKSKSRGNIDESNIVRGKRVRKKTPTTASTHLYKLAIAEDDETQFAPQQGMTDGLRYEDVCLFTRVLRKPEKQLRLIPQIVEARKKEVQGLYDAKCLQWATWRDAEKDKVKPIRTGFVDAIKVDEATGENELGVVGVDESFPPAMVYDVRSLPWIVLLRTDDMLVFCMKVEQHDELIRRLRAARFRFTDKGDVEAYIDRLLQDRGFENAKPSATPYADLGKCKFTHRSRSGVRDHFDVIGGAQHDCNTELLRGDWDTLAEAIHRLRGQPRIDTDNNQRTLLLVLRDYNCSSSSFELRKWKHRLRFQTKDLCYKDLVQS
eukprot:g1942.t1